MTTLIAQWIWRVGDPAPRNVLMQYDSNDLKPHPQAGQNVIAVAVSHWGEGAFQQMAARGISVNAICPGYIETELSLEYWNTFRDPDAERWRAYRLHPPGRIGTPDEVAWPALFLASDEAGFVNGATLMVDGGRSVLYHGDEEAPTAQ